MPKLVMSLEFIVNSCKNKITTNYPLITNNCKSKGFTLIELLVVISIIAILSVIGMVLYGGVQSKARDTTRRGDIDAIANVLEAHYTPGTANPYPIPDPNWFNSGAIPRDPKGTNYYWNAWNNGCSVDTESFATATEPSNGFPGAIYNVCALLEGANGNSSTIGGADNPFFTPATGSEAKCYCRRNSQ